MFQCPALFHDDREKMPRWLAEKETGLDCVVLFDRRAMATTAVADVLGRGRLVSLRSALALWDKLVVSAC